MTFDPDIDDLIKLFYKRYRELQESEVLLGELWFDPKLAIRQAYPELYAKLDEFFRNKKIY